MSRSDNTETGTTQAHEQHALNRRNILLGGTSFAAASAVAAASQVQVAQAQQQQPAAPAGQRPNILVIWGDDVGLANVSAYSFGLMVTGHRTSTESPVKE
jgi:hypothetical protein